MYWEPRFDAHQWKDVACQRTRKLDKRSHGRQKSGRCHGIYPVKNRFFGSEEQIEVYSFARAGDPQIVSNHAYDPVTGWIQRIWAAGQVPTYMIHRIL